MRAPYVQRESRAGPGVNPLLGAGACAFDVDDQVTKAEGGHGPGAGVAPGGRIVERPRRSCGPCSPRFRSRGRVLGKVRPPGRRWLRRVVACRGLLPLVRRTFRCGWGEGAGDACGDGRCPAGLGLRAGMRRKVRLIGGRGLGRGGTGGLLGPVVSGPADAGRGRGEFRGPWRRPRAALARVAGLVCPRGAGEPVRRAGGRAGVCRTRVRRAARTARRTTRRRPRGAPGPWPPAWASPGSTACEGPRAGRRPTGGGCPSPSFCDYAQMITMRVKMLWLSMLIHA